MFVVSLATIYLKKEILYIVLLLVLIRPNTDDRRPGSNSLQHMNFNLIAALIAICVSFATAIPEGRSDKLVQAPPVKHNKHSRRNSRPIKSSSFSVVPRSSSSLKFASELHENSKACTRRLEEILFSPPSTVKNYLAKIAMEMRTDIQVIMAAFAGGNLEYIRTYVNRYNILITMAGPFGLPVLVGPTIVAYTEPLKNVATAQTDAGRDGFYADPRNFYYNYQFSLMSSNGQYITFVLSLALSAMTNSPTNC